MRAREGKLAGKLGVTGVAIAQRRGKIWQAGPMGERMGARERAEASAPRLGLNGERVGSVARKRSEAGACAGGAGPCGEGASWAGVNTGQGRAERDVWCWANREKRGGLQVWAVGLGWGFGFSFLFTSLLYF